jgi:two-component system phosphate regulon response regulator PhoB
MPPVGLDGHPKPGYSWGVSDEPAPKLVLIVDDDSSMRDIMDFTVKKEGFRTAVTGDGQDALVKVEALRPDLILLDFMIPGMGGYEVLRELQSRGHGGIPIVIVTGRMMGEQGLALLRQESNVKEVLQKPFKTGVIAVSLHRVLGTTPPRSPRHDGAGGAFG